jgi:hypothetical protein
MLLLTLAEVAAARKEIAAKPTAEIEFETSRKWAARAVAAYELAGDACDVVRLSDAVGFHQEALEHAASASVEWLAKLSAELGAIQACAFELFDRSLLVAAPEPGEAG